MTISITGQIQEIEREIALREKVYPHQVASGRMRQAVADYHMERMHAVLATLKWIDAHSAQIRDKIKDPI